MIIENLNLNEAIKFIENLLENQEFEMVEDTKYNDGNNGILTISDYFIEIKALGVRVYDGVKWDYDPSNNDHTPSYDCIVFYDIDSEEPYVIYGVNMETAILYLASSQNKHDLLNNAEISFYRT